jgi:tungstate transport system substrate-binding protein
LPKLLGLILMIWASTSAAETVRLAVTTSFQNSGLSDFLLPKIKSDIGIELQVLVVGTGQALKLGQAGDVDAVLVHSRADEELWVASDYGPYRRELMYNDYVLIGPTKDPASIGGLTFASEALIEISEGGHLFVSRGDDSGTHKAEQALWQAARIAEMGNWYRSVGAGMGATLNTAVAMGGYVLADRASWLNFGNKSNMSILLEGDPALFNQYAFLPVSEARHPHVKREVVQRLENWLVGSLGQNAIQEYRLGGVQLFFPNAK